MCMIKYSRWPLLRIRIRGPFPLLTRSFCDILPLDFALHDSFDHLSSQLIRLRKPPLEESARSFKPFAINFEYAEAHALTPTPSRYHKLQVIAAMPGVKKRGMDRRRQQMWRNEEMLRDAEEEPEYRRCSQL